MSPACPPERAPIPRASYGAISGIAGWPRAGLFFFAAPLSEGLRRVAVAFAASFFLAARRGRAAFLCLSRFLLFFGLAIRRLRQFLSCFYTPGAGKSSLWNDALIRCKSDL